MLGIKQGSGDKSEQRGPVLALWDFIAQLSSHDLMWVKLGKAVLI